MTLDPDDLDGWEGLVAARVEFTLIDGDVFEARVGGVSVDPDDLAGLVCSTRLLPGGARRLVRTLEVASIVVVPED